MTEQRHIKKIIFFRFRTTFIICARTKWLLARQMESGNGLSLHMDGIEYFDCTSRFLNIEF